MFQDCLNDKVAELIIDENLYAFKRDTNQVFLPLALRSRDTIFDHLASVLIACDLSKMLNDWVINDRAALICLQKNQALSQDMIAPDIAAKLEYSTILQCFKD